MIGVFRILSRCFTYRDIYFGILVLSVCFPTILQANELPPEVTNATDWRLRDKAQQEEIEQRLSDTPPMKVPTDSDVPLPPQESPCFNIDAIDIEGEFVDVAQGLDLNYIGRCIGQQGIALYIRALNKRLLSLGYVTSRAVLTEQDLSSGKLNIRILSGAVESIEFPESYTVKWEHALPVDLNKPLNIRDMEQGIDQLNRLPSQSIKFDIEPGSKQGTSRLVAKVTEGKQWTGGLSLDDAGSEATGEYQISGDLSASNIIGIQDKISVSGGRDIDDDNDNGSYNYATSIEVPYGYWLFSASLNGSDYTQLVSGAVQQFTSSGDSQDTKLKASYNAHRDNNSKASLDFTLRKRTRRGFINDTEVEVQKRNLTDIQIAGRYTHYLGAAVLNVSLTAYQGVPLLGAEDGQDSQQALEPNYLYFSLVNALSAPLTIGGHPFNVSSQLLVQHADTSIYSLDWFSNGGRYTVRGFSSSNAISAENGWRIRNDLSTQLLSGRLNPYFGWDVGGVWGDGAKSLSEKEVMGIAIGIKGWLAQVNYDLFVSQPLEFNGPQNEHCCQVGARLAWRY